jgi:hypothetical protein
MFQESEGSRALAQPCPAVMNPRTPLAPQHLPIASLCKLTGEPCGHRIPADLILSPCYQSVPGRVRSIRTTTCALINNTRHGYRRPIGASYSSQEEDTTSSICLVSLLNGDGRLASNHFCWTRGARHADAMTTLHYEYTVKNSHRSPQRLAESLAAPSRCIENGRQYSAIRLQHFHSNSSIWA